MNKQIYQIHVPKSQPLNSEYITPPRTIMILILVILISSGTKVFSKIEFKDHQLIAHGEAMPQLYGAELQYFRLRGGIGKNIDPELVYRTWEKALDYMLEAKMNSISFYIPWDFHEYKEGYFDFTGSADEDGDGRADYPSRNLVKFLAMVIQKGFKSIMIRPGPFINAEWGFLGFGAIPLWFHEKYPDSHMQSSSGHYVKLWNYLDPRLMEYTEKFFRALNNNVLQPHCFNKGATHCPIHFIQVDNETNYMWQTIYNLDYGPIATKAYQNYLNQKYKTLDSVNKAHQTQWGNWSDIHGPFEFGKQTTQDQDWYDFHDFTIYDYLKKVRGIWEKLGFKEPRDVYFTLAEAYTAMNHGLLPNMKLRNSPGKTGMATVNLYVKTFEKGQHHMHDTPFRTDHDVKQAETANDYYIGGKNQWVMGPEIQGGWWINTPVSIPSRKQTYLTAIGHGLKFHNVYYFSEGFNWQWDWFYNKTKDIFERELEKSDYADHPYEEIPSSFWTQIKKIMSLTLFDTFEDPKKLLSEGPEMGPILKFNAPLNHLAQPQENYPILKEIGEKVIQPYGKFLGKAIEWEDPIVLLKDPMAQQPTNIPGLDNIKLNADWSGGIIGGLMLLGYNPKILNWGINDKKALFQAKAIFYQDAGFKNPELAHFLAEYVKGGGILINFFGTEAIKQMNFHLDGPEQDFPAGETLVANSFYLNSEQQYSYKFHSKEHCDYLNYNIFSEFVVQCSYGPSNGTVIQSGLSLHEFFNRNEYEYDKSLKERLYLFKSQIRSVENRVEKSIEVQGERTVAFARVLPAPSSPLFITVKTASRSDVEVKLKFSNKLISYLPQKETYKVKNIFENEVQDISQKDLAKKGITFKLKAQDTTQLFIE